MGVTRRELTALIIIIAVVIVGALVYKKYRKAPAVTSTPVATSNPQIVKSIEDKFRVQIPDNAQSADLQDISGGNGLGLVTKEEKNNVINLTILADLPDPQKGLFYQAWAVNGNIDIVSLGKMTIAKGGYLLDVKISSSFEKYSTILVTLEKRFDKVPETRILEGTFK